jgi:uncharacterized membrane protein (DUF485 family)
MTGRESSSERPIGHERPSERVANEAELRSHDYNWDELAAMPEFQELVRARRRFIGIAMVLFLGCLLAFVVLVVYARGFTGSFAIGNFTLGYLLGLGLLVVSVATAVALRSAV